jgi:hypothetical protein
MTTPQFIIEYPGQNGTVNINAIRALKKSGTRIQTVDLYEGWP